MTPSPLLYRPFAGRVHLIDHAGNLGAPVADTLLSEALTRWRRRANEHVAADRMDCAEAASRLADEIAHALATAAEQRAAQQGEAA